MEALKHPHLHPDLQVAEFSLDSILIAPDCIPESRGLNQIDLSVQLSPTLRIKRPFVSAAMDRVTRARMGILLGNHGGISCIDFNLPIDEQADEVRTVRKDRSAVILEPVVVSPQTTIQQAFELAAELGFSSFPITENGKRDSRLIGMVTSKDLESAKDILSSVESVMTPRAELVVAHRKDTLDTGSIKPANDIIREKKLNILPITDDKDHIVGLVARKDIKKNDDSPYATKDANKQLKVLVAVESTLSHAAPRIEATAEAGACGFVIDSRNLYGEYALIARFIKEHYPETTVIVGNVVSANAVRQAVETAGRFIDVFKVGIGTGEVCTTSEDMGVGRAMGSSLRDIAYFLRENNLPHTLIADGGIKTAGHIGKALALGATAVMMGSVLAGFEESPTEKIWKDDRFVKEIRGMGSYEAARERAGRSRYMASNSEAVYEEGTRKTTAYKGPGGPHLEHYALGLQKILQAVDCMTVDEFQRVPTIEDVEAGRRKYILVPAVPAASKGTL